MSSVFSARVRDAVVLAAGNGDRFQNSNGRSKLLQPVLGQPLILRTLATAAGAGISAFEIVVGYQASLVRDVIRRGAPRGTTVQFTYNPEWELENGVSAMTVRHRFPDRRFALLMGDHVFEPQVLARLLKMPVRHDESILAIDRRPAPPDVAAEATKVQMADQYITAVGKDLVEYDALDTGLFVCAPSLFEALEISRRKGDTTLSGGIRHLAARGLMRGADVNGASWYDIDTVADLASAESLLGIESEPEVA